VITLITGAPGAGKSAALVDLLSTECARRALFVDGIPELRLPHVELTKPREWMTEVEDGGAVVIDEVQRIWRPRGSAAAVPADVTTAMTDAKADSLAVAGLALIIIIAIAAFKYMKKAV